MTILNHNPIAPVLSLLMCLVMSQHAIADETCMSPYMAKIVGQEDFVYVWTLGMEGLGDEQDKLVTIDVNPASENYGKVVHTLSVGGRNEAHHSGLTDDRRYLWAGGLDTSRIFIFNIHSDPARPRLYRTIDNFVARSGGVVGLEDGLRGLGPVSGLIHYGASLVSRWCPYTWGRSF